MEIKIDLLLFKFFNIKITNGMKRQFNVNDTDTLKIKKWLEGTEDQFIFNLYFKSNYDLKKPVYHFRLICLLVIKFYSS